MELKRKLYDLMGMPALALKTDHAEYLGVKPGDIVIVRFEENEKKQKYLSMWKDGE